MTIRIPELSLAILCPLNKTLVLVKAMKRERTPTTSNDDDEGAIMLLVFSLKVLEEDLEVELLGVKRIWVCIVCCIDSFQLKRVKLTGVGVELKHKYSLVACL